MYAGTMILAKIMDKAYAILKKRAGGVGQPEFRLRKTTYDHSLVFDTAHCLRSQRPSYLAPSSFLPVSSSQAGLQKPKPIGSVPTSYAAKFLLRVPKISQVNSQGLVIAGAGIIICSTGVQSYVIDSYGIHSASGLAAVGTLRSLAGFGFPLFAPAMYKSLGYGKGNTILFATAVTIGWPA